MGLLIASLLLGIAWLWAILAIRYFVALPGVIRLLLLALLLLAPPAAFAAGGWIAAAIVAAAATAPVVIGWLLIEPRNDLDWAPDQARIPVIEYDGDRVTVHNLRRAEYRSREDYDVEWFSRTFDLSKVRTVDYVVEPFGKLPAMAHTFVTFGFADGYYLPISIEIRRERPESFNPIAGIYRQYEIMYVMGDERDLIGLRANIRKDEVFVYPVRATRNQVRNLLEAMLLRADHLSAKPEFYNTLLNNCATNILRHMNQLQGRRFPIDYRVIAPGLSDRYAYEKGLIDSDIPFEETKALFRINDRSTIDGETEQEWSRKIRNVSAAAVEHAV